MSESVNTSRFHYNPVSTNSLALHKGCSGLIWYPLFCEVRKYLSGRFLHSVGFIGQRPGFSQTVRRSNTHKTVVSAHALCAVFMLVKRIFSD
jgi:hypothetical protein